MKLARIYNKSYLRLCRLLSVSGFKNCEDLTHVRNERLVKVRPFDSRLSEGDKGIILTEVMNNPWYVLRELIRVEVGTTKRFIQLSNGEMLALVNTIYGGRTFMSAPHGTCNTNTLVLLAVMLKPRVVLYTRQGNGFKNRVFESDFLKIYDSYVELMPAFVQSYYSSRRPVMVPIGDILQPSTEAGVITVPDYKASDVIIVSDRYELGNVHICDSLLGKIDALCDIGNGRRIPWLLTSSQSDEFEIPSTIKKLGVCDHNDVGKGNDIKLSVSIEDMPRFNSDRSKVLYYQGLIDRYGLDAIFEPRQ